MRSDVYFPEFANSLEIHVRPAAKKLHGYKDRRRIRVGTYRVVYAIDDGRRSVDITRVAHRKDAYE
jgi:mRNA-degrading endonuclease RelE of RelBE toxin-antitoxin system